MTLDDLLKERNCEVTFSSLRGELASKRIECAIRFDRDPCASWRSEDIIVTGGQVLVSGKGQSAIPAFSEAVQKLRTYLETVK